ncbi:putative T7SS-secreted protein [Streptomyces sp. NPDC026659]|uniref:putative T7SS-secreted protein n=1 Tax=Streptomyces sp. NPDC026659 TaxID=3155123 RepID=UPI0033E4D37F
MSTQTYEALGFDPAPGVPASVERLVTSLTGVGKRLHDAHTTLTRLGRSNGAWAGEAASAFAKQVGSLPKYLAEGHTSLTDAAHALHGWDTRLREFQSLARRYESEAAAARKALKAAQGNPDLGLAGKTFDTEEELHDAQQRLNHATKRVHDARADLDDILKKAQRLLADHDAAAAAAASMLRRAAEIAPDASLLDKLGDLLSSIGDEIEKLAGDLWKWVQKHADTIYEIGDWLGYASAACDVLAVITSETVVGAIAFEAIGMVLNGGALAFHGVGWAAGSKKGNALDIGLDLVGFVPFGDLLRGGKIAKGALTGVKIPMNLLDFGAKAADSWKRAGDIIDHVGGTAKFGTDTEKWVMRNVGALGRKAQAIHITADTLKDRFHVALAKELGDRVLYKAGTKLTDKGFQKLMPQLIEKTPLRRIPALADSVRPIVDETGKVVDHYIDPRSWTARGYEAVTGTKDLYKEAVRLSNEDVQYGSEKIHEKIDQAREKAGQTLGRLASANPFG